MSLKTFSRWIAPKEAIDFSDLSTERVADYAKRSQPGMPVFEAAVGELLRRREVFRQAQTEDLTRTIIKVTLGPGEFFPDVGGEEAGIILRRIMEYEEQKKEEQPSQTSSN